MDLDYIEALKAAVKLSQENKTNAPLDLWFVNKAKHQLDACQLLRINDVKRLTTLSKSTIALWVAQSRFPRPIPLSLTVKVWRLSDIKDWLDQQSTESEGERNV
jgi:prophage regulatory protein